MSLKSMSAALFGMVACTAACNGNTVLGSGATGGAAGVAAVGGAAGQDMSGAGGTGGTAGTGGVGGTGGTDNPIGQPCGGFILNPPPCPDGFQCVFPPNPVPDQGGTCQRSVCELIHDPPFCSGGCAAYGLICDPSGTTSFCLCPVTNCTNGDDRSCNDDTSVLSQLGQCSYFGACICTVGTVKSAITGKCQRLQPLRCGGNVANPTICPAGLDCVPDPANGNLPFGDVGGICQSTSTQGCGLGFPQCPVDTVCGGFGGVDLGGRCQQLCPATLTEQSCDDPTRSFYCVSADAQQFSSCGCRSASADGGPFAWTCVTGTLTR